MEFGPPKINEVFDMQGKKKIFSPPGKKARGLSHAPQCLVDLNFLHIILSLLRHLKITVSTKILY